MPFVMDWLVPGHVVYVRAWGIISDDDLNQWEPQARHNLAAATAPLVHSIYDYRDAEGMPSLARLRKLDVINHPQIGWTVFVGLQNKVIKFSLSVTTQLFQVRVRFVDTMDEAFEFIRYIDDTVPDLKALPLPVEPAERGG